MQQSMLHVSLLVKDYDEAIDFYVGKLQFELIEDTRLDESKRWIVVKPPGQGVASLVLAKACTEAEVSQIGNQCGGRVFLFLSTDNFQRDYDRMKASGIQFTREPETHDYGTVAVFADLYGNQWDLLQPGVNHRLYAQLHHAT